MSILPSASFGFLRLKNPSPSLSLSAYIIPSTLCLHVVSQSIELCSQSIHPTSYCDMGPLVKLIGSGIGLASEALSARKENKQRARSPGPSDPSELSGTASDSGNRAPPAYDSLNPTSANYGLVEVANEHEARQLINQGKAVPADTSHDFNDDDLEGADDDEAYWELDEATDPDPPAYDYSPSVRGGIDYAEPKSGEAKPDVHKLVQKFLASHPAPTRGTARLPCPVIIPQRRPRTKSRGFVRAYAPVLDDCGIDQDAFLEFLKIFHEASQVSRHSPLPMILVLRAPMSKPRC